MTWWCLPHFWFSHLKLTHTILDISCEGKYITEQVPEISSSQLYTAFSGPALGSTACWNLKAGESCAWCYLSAACCSYQLGYLSNWAVSGWYRYWNCFFPFRSLRKSQAMFKLLGGTLSTTVLVRPIKPLTNFGMRIDKILTLPKSWQGAASRLPPGFPQPLSVPHILGVQVYSMNPTDLWQGLCKWHLNKNSLMAETKTAVP